MVADRLAPRAGATPMLPGEIVRRLRDEFTHVEADREAGADVVGDMITTLLRNQAPQEVVDEHLRARDHAVRLIVADGTDDEEAFLSFVALPGHTLFIGYHSADHQRAARPILERCARVLGYAIEVP